MEYIKIFFAAVGGRFFLLPGFVSGMAGLVGLLKGLGMSGLPDISWWAIALFVVLPLSLWSVPALVLKVVKLERQLKPKFRLIYANVPGHIDKIQTAQMPYCIGIKNESDKTIPGVRVKVGGKFADGFFPKELHRRDDKAETFDLYLGDPEWLELGYVDENNKKILCVNPSAGHKTIVGGKKGKIHIKVSAKNAPMSTFLFWLRHDKHGRMWLEEREDKIKRPLLSIKKNMARGKYVSLAHTTSSPNESEVDTLHIVGVCVNRIGKLFTSNLQQFDGTRRVLRGMMGVRNPLAFGTHPLIRIID